MEKRDQRNEHFIRHPEELELIPAEFKPVHKPLRGYLQVEDYEKLAKAKDFLYSEHDLERLEAGMNEVVKRYDPKKSNSIKVKQSEVDALMHKCRTY